MFSINMNEKDFFFNVESESEIIRQHQSKYNETQKKRKSYASVIISDDVPFDNLEIEKKILLDDLNKQKSFGVEEFTFFRKWEEVTREYKVNKSISSDWKRKGRSKIWQPDCWKNNEDDEQIIIKEIESIRPVVVVVDCPEKTLLWNTLRMYCHSAEYDQAPGRCIKFLVIDENTEKVIGLMSVASDVISIACRDKYIGWTLENKLERKMLRHSAIGTTIAPTQPFGTNFLGGKLIAALVTSGVIRSEWENPTISNDSNPCKLVGMTTTSLYGNSKGNFSMYNGLKWWKPVGLSNGNVLIKPSDEIYERWHTWLKKTYKLEYEKKMTQKEGVSGPVTGAKQRVLSMMFRELGVSASNYVHGYKRGTYYSCFYHNTKEFLCNKIAEKDLVMKPLFKEDVQAIIDWWRPKAIKRYKKLRSEGRINMKKLYYEDMETMSYEEAKTKFFSAVGS
jgi:hypothetical protein